MRVSGVTRVTTKPAFVFSEPRILPGGGAFGFVVGGATDPRQMDAMADGRVVAVVDAERATPTGSVTEAPQLQIVLNWFSELQQRVPAR